MRLRERRPADRGRRVLHRHGRDRRTLPREARPAAQGHNPAERRLPQLSGGVLRNRQLPGPARHQRPHGEHPPGDGSPCGDDLRHHRRREPQPLRQHLQPAGARVPIPQHRRPYRRSVVMADRLRRGPRLPEFGIRNPLHPHRHRRAHRRVCIRLRRSAGGDSF